MAGETRGVVDRDLDKTADLLVKAREAASKAGDDAFVKQIDEPLSLLKSEGITIPSSSTDNK